MKKITLILTLLFSTVMFSSPSYAGWTKVTKNVTGDTFYVDYERIRKHGDYVYYWQLNDYLKPEKNGTLSVKAYRKGDCRLLRYTFLNITLYKGPMGGGTTINSFNYNKNNWRYFVPDSVDERVIKFVCPR